MSDKPTVLAVDDENDVLLILRTALSEEFNVLTASNGPEALEIANAKKPDLIILDYMMPDMDGLEVMDKLKASNATVDIPVVFLTGVSDKETIRAALGKGTAYYLTKPFGMDDLIAKVQLAIKESQSDF